jgi:hypothetical protein
MSCNATSCVRSRRGRPDSSAAAAQCSLVGYSHRRTDDLDLFTTEDAAMRDAGRVARAIAADIGAVAEATQTSPDFRRYAFRRGSDAMVVDFP